MQISCPNCGLTFDLLTALSDEDARRFFGLMREIPPVLVRPLIGYLGLFKPAKSRLTWKRMLTITRELLPMFKDARLNRNHQVHVVPAEIWAAAMDALVESPPASLRRPLKSNGYLFEIVAGNCERAEAKIETQREKARRNRSDQDKKIPQGKSAPSAADRESHAEKEHEKRLARYLKKLEPNQVEKTKTAK